MLAAEVKQYFSHLAQQCAIGHPKHLVGRTGRIGQGAEDVEHRADADLAPRRADVFHSWMVGWGVHETKSDLLHAKRDLLRAKVDACAQGFQYVCTATPAGGRTVAMLCHVCTCSGCNDAGGRRDIKCTGA